MLRMGGTVPVKVRVPDVCAIKGREAKIATINEKRNTFFLFIYFFLLLLYIAQFA